ncbi:MAG: hypothetical protein IJC71_02440 [Clostridia bacterium]|nr:hypothetical protein [Clostridia bacterium]
MFTENYAGGVFLSFENPLTLSDEVKAKLIEKWDAANEDGEVEDLIAEAEAIAAPKGFIMPTDIDEIGDGYVVLNGIRFKSVLLADKLAPAYEAGSKIYFFTMTCGMELHEWAMANPDVLLKGVAEDICLTYLSIAGRALRQYVQDNFYAGKHFSAMNPGSLPAWNIRGQVPTFELLGEGAVRCGVSIGESMLMTPFKSGSGVYFETAHDYENCMFCDKLDCPNRRAKYTMDYPAAQEV